VKKIMVVDDEEGFTKLLKMNLEKSGEYEVEIENKSTKALEVARRFQPDLVLLDIVMPDMDGGVVAAQFQDDPILRRVPVIMLTALVAEGETTSGTVAQSGTMSVLPKPVNMDVLKSCLEEALSGEN
jgi:CheY-like chemotaxis protein